MRGGALAAAGGLLVALGACAGRGPTPAPPAPPPDRSASGLRVALTWAAGVDLDLYLTDPTAETVYFGNNPTRTGARLVRDVRCGGDAPAVEVVELDRPPPGRYRIGVDFIDACGSRRREAGFRVVTDVGARRRETTGVARLEMFQPIVLEFDLREATDGSIELAP
jgi:hypothetical protein